MMSPKRIQRKRTPGWRLPEGAICVDRSSKWGNPYHIGAPDPMFTGNILTAEDAVRMFEWYAVAQLFRDPHHFDALRGNDLACFCPLDQPCHADVLLRLANK